MTVTRETLFAKRAETASGLPEDDVDLPGLGVVRVRGLNRKEAVHVQLASDPTERDRRLIAQGLVDPMLMVPGLLHSLGDKPCLKCADAGLWQEASTAGEMEPVSDRITALSGIGKDAAKEAYKSDGEGSVAGVRILPGEQAGDDGGPATDGDVG